MLVYATSYVNTHNGPHSSSIEVTVDILLAWHHKQPYNTPLLCVDSKFTLWSRLSRSPIAMYTTTVPLVK